MTTAWARFLTGPRWYNRWTLAILASVAASRSLYRRKQK